MDEKWKVMGSGEWAVFYCHIAPPAGEGGAAGTKGGEGGGERREGAAFRSILSVPF